jgi:uncharacterized protein (DUF2236 family)
MLLQALHPTTMAIFERNTHYRADPWRRFRRTVHYFADTIFGDTATAEAVAARLRALHRQLKADDPVTGEIRRADDPELLLWVYATSVDSFIVAYRRFAGGLSDDDANRYVAEMVRFAELLGLPAADVPNALGALRNYLEGVTGLIATPAARDGMRMILFSPPIPMPLWPAWSIVSAAVISILPEWARAMYALPWFPVADPPIRATTFGVTRLLNLFAPRLPWIQKAIVGSA